MFDTHTLLVTPEREAEIKEEAKTWKSWALSLRQQCDLELILNGAFAPLSTFLGRADYESVLDRVRLADGSVWPMTVVLDVPRDFAEKVEIGSEIALRDLEGVIHGVLTVTESWEPDRSKEAEAIFGTTSRDHVGVKYLMESCHPVYLSGKLEGVRLPFHYDFRDLRRTPAAVKAEFEKRGWSKVVAFNTRNPMHRAHFELTRRAAEQIDGNLLVHPVVGMTKPGDIDHYTRVRCYQSLLKHYPENSALLSLIPLAMRMAGPREALWHALIRKNYGATHFIVGRDHAGPGPDSNGKPFYDPYAAQALVSEHQGEAGIEMIPFQAVAYVEELKSYLPADEIKEGQTTLSLSGTELREHLKKGTEVPEWFTFPEVADELRRTHPPRKSQGFTVFFTGLPSSGKSTLANVLRIRLLENGNKPVTLLDGDIVRTHLSSELGFSREHRDLNIQRIGFVSSEITKNRGVAICAPIAPYDAVRKDVRQMIENVGGFVLVHVATPLEECEQRDRKGLYAKAREGIIKEFTGISDPYEAPEDAELVINTVELGPDEAVQMVVDYLESEGYL